jgi:hypothetical protein
MPPKLMYLQQIGTHLKHHIRRKKRRENVQQRNETPNNTDYVPHGANDGVSKCIDIRLKQKYHDII